MTSGLLDTAFKSINKVTKELTKVAQESVKHYEAEIVDMNTDQLMQGKNSKGKSLESIGGPYAPYTIEKKKLKGQPLYPTLYDEGDFHEDFYLDVNKTIYQIDSKDSKRNKLVKDWGLDIFGNTKADEKEVNEKYVLPDLLEHIIENVEI